MLSVNKAFLKGLLQFSLMLLLSKTANAEDGPAVFDVNKTLPLKNGAKVYRDFYINGGKEKGLRPGMIVTVFRRISMYDHYQNSSPGEIKVPVGTLKIIYVQKGVSVARMHSRISRQNVPLLDYNHIMIGDRLDLSTAKMDRGLNEKQNSASASPPMEQKTTVELPVVEKKESSSTLPEPAPAPAPAKQMAAKEEPSAKDQPVVNQTNL